LGACLASLAALRYPKDRHEILLIDNGSTDRTLDIARSFSEVAIYLKLDAKVGAVRNYGVQQSVGSVLVFLDSDCVVEPDWLMSGVGKLMANPQAVLGGRYLLRDDPSWLERYWILKPPGRTNPNASLLGGCIFIPKRIFQQMGGFDESLNAGEDSDLTARLKKAGYRVEIDPALNVVHLGYPSRVGPFIARQLWHSSDYISGLPSTLGDRTFQLTLVFMAGLVVVFGSLLFLPQAYLTLVVAAAVVVICPAVSSVKRLKRAGAKDRRLFDYVSIYLVDWLYLVGRALGVLSGVKNRLSFKAEAKVQRR
ncbi:MAG TPA: glycosyltransferase, partial [Desulfurivibrionaceae bacterium]|nr:glycosyltransferase [Desulfurivibrionaceae bacterium]